MKRFMLLLLLLAGCNLPVPDDIIDDDTKKGAELLLIVLDDADNRTAESAPLISNDQNWQKIKAQGHDYRVLQVSNPAAAEYKEAAAGAQPPALLIYRARDMKLLSPAMKMPTDEKVLDDVVTKYGGKKERGPPIHVDSTGEVRRLGVMPPDAKVKARRMDLQGFGVFLQKKGVSLIPPEKWREVDYPRLHKAEFVLNQQSTSGCVGFSCAAANMKMRVLRGMRFERLSGAFVYSLINGGRDSGAMIDDSRLAISKYGVCLDTENPLPKIFWRQVSDEAKASAEKRQMLMAYRIDNIQELATALQLGLIVQAGVQVDGRFESFDANGVSRASGQYANHSIHLYGMKKIGDRWVYRMGNTWGSSWGPFRDGSCYLTASGIVIEGDAFVHVDGEILQEDLPHPKPKIQPLSLVESMKGTPDVSYVLAP